MISVILCGGVGARLWPVSRELYPKPFMRLHDGQSFIQKTFLRGASVPDVKGMLTVTNRNLSFKIAEEYEKLGMTLPAGYVLEPTGRNTAPAIAAAALIVAREYGGEEPMIVLPSDHLVASPDRFAESVQEALAFARDGKLVTFGIVPTAPKTGFGYIEVDGASAKRFVEKPSLETAEEYVASGRFLWNSGMFCFKAGTILSELSLHAPELLSAAEECVDASPVERGEDPRAALSIELDQNLFAAVTSISIDCAVFEKSANIAVVHGDFGWSDIGSWNELCDLDGDLKDRDGNRVVDASTVVLHDTRNCYINNKGRLVATVGVDNLLIVDTEDAVLVANKSKDQDVKAVFARLREMDHETCRQHRTIHQPWGYFTLLETGSRFKIKRLVLKPGAQISLQRHYNRSEHWIVVSGTAEVTRDDTTYFVNSNESTYIKAGSKHRVANPGKVELVLIEVQSGDYLGEDDIVRFDDIYGRV